MLSTKKTTKAPEQMAPEPQEPVALSLADLKAAKLLEGEDAPLTDQIYGVALQPAALADPLPLANRDFQGLDDPLQRFISQYEPGELILRQNFRRDLLRILEDWRLQDVKE
jgi:hypothetical protein